ncbi:MAG: hypothetical protein LUD27_08290, partial [Clostridia bacterium]|nr:hypothetical protein [Clostridia bacterium]
MAVAAPVYERSIGKDSYVENNFGSPMTDDEIHNAKIKDIYAKIINPEYKMSDLKSEIDKTTYK